MRVTVAHKLALSFGVICLLALLPALFQVQRLQEVHRVVDTITTDDLAVSDAIRSLTHLQSRLRSRRETAIVVASAAIAAGRPYDIAQQEREYGEFDRQVREAVRGLLPVVGERLADPLSPERERFWAHLDTLLRGLEQDLQSAAGEAAKLFPPLREGKLAETMAQRGRVEAIRQGIDATLNQINGIGRQLADAGRSLVQETYSEVIRFVLLTALLVFAVAVAIAGLVSRSLTKRLSHMVEVVRHIGGGDLTRRVSVSGSDEIAFLGESLNDMVGKLHSFSRATRTAAESVHAATAQIRAATQEQAAGVAEQLAALEETLATLTEIGESGRQIRQRSEQVARSAEDTAASGRSGLLAVDATVEAMNAIREQVETVAENIVLLSERTQAIGEIIITVNDIAERSHLLALNAAIEAAAAGERGRTFSIVADEIKSLADQAKQATGQVRSNLSEIQHGINSSVMLTEEAVKRVEAGIRQTGATQATIRDMAGNVQEGAVAFQQTVAGTNQQQIGLEQVMVALQNIREASTQTAAATRQLEGAASSLNGLGQDLVEGVRSYRL